MQAYRWIKQALPFLLIIAVAIFLRFYRLSETIRFNGDQGLDLLILWFMEHAHHAPMVGPFLSLQGVFTPPTYYYLSWFAYSWSKTIPGLVTVYAVCNLLTIILLMRLAYNLAGRRASLMMGILCAVSSIMIDHSRTYWQPYLMQLFLVTYLYLLWHAFELKSEWLIGVSTLSYMLAFSIYPSPILLFPYVLFQLYRWQKLQGRSIVQCVLRPVLYIAGSFLLVFSPEIYFEYTHSFPTLHAIQTVGSSSVNPPISMTILKNIFQLLSVYFGFSVFPQWLAGLLLIIFAILSVWFTCTHPLSRKIYQFLSPPTLIIGTAFLSVYPFDIYSHRAWSLLPYFFLSFSLLLSASFTGKNKWGIFFFLSIFLGTNIVISLQYFLPYPKNEQNEAHHIAQLIENDMRDHDVTWNMAGVFEKIPNDPTNGSYGIYRVLYYLVKNGSLRLSLTPAGNDISYAYSAPPQTPIVYLICRWYFPDRNHQCMRDAGYSVDYTVQQTNRIGTSLLYRLQRKNTVPTSNSHAIIE